MILDANMLIKNAMYNIYYSYLDNHANLEDFATNIIYKWSNWSIKLSILLIYQTTIKHEQNQTYTNRKQL